MSKSDNIRAERMHELIEHIWSHDTDHISADILHRYIDEITLVCELLKVDNGTLRAALVEIKRKVEELEKKLVRLRENLNAS